MNEAQKFFDPSDLTCKPWTYQSWCDDTSISTVWIIRESLLSNQTDFVNLISDPMFRFHTDILCTFVDEAHIAWRSFTSTRGKVLRERMLPYCRFTCFLSGTMFPLGPTEDAESVLHYCGGGFGGDSCIGKWSRPQIRAFRRLFEERSLDIPSFRILIEPFTLRRTCFSRFNGDAIVNQQYSYPEPHVIQPHTDERSEQFAESVFRDSDQNRQRKESLRKLMERADNRTMIAWCQHYSDALNQLRTQRSEVQKIAVYQNVFIQHIRMDTLSGRVRKMIERVQWAKDTGRRCIIVAERLFLVTLAYYVGSLSRSS